MRGHFRPRTSHPELDSADSNLFACEDGTLAGWRAALGTTAEVVVCQNSAEGPGRTVRTHRLHPASMRTQTTIARCSVLPPLSA